MLINQLVYVCEIVDQGFNVSKAAAVHRTSQPSISRHVQSFEQELGFQIFNRSKRKILGLTKPGAQLLDAARDIIGATRSLRNIGADFVSDDAGTLVVSASHAQARYVLPAVIQSFNQSHPKVQVILRQGTPAQVEDWVKRGQADLAILSRSPLQPVQPGLALLPCHEERKLLITPSRHPLLKERPLNLEALARYELITFDTQFSTHSQVMRAFKNAGLQPKVILSATDADVIKTYVKHGLGIAIVGESAYIPEEDRGLRRIEVHHLFQSNMVYVGLEKQAYVRGFVSDFISLFAPGVTREKVMSAVSIR